MRRVVIIHCWGGYSEYCWYPWAKNELERAGFNVLVPNMPDTEKPQLSKWLPMLKDIIGQSDEDLYLIGHSAGSITILRYLEGLKERERIGGAVLVAGFTDSLGYTELENFYTTPIDFKEIKKHCNHFATIHSDNDPYVSLKYATILKESLGAQSIIKHNAKHFSGPRENKDSCTELPDVVSSILDWQRSE
jgi:predicted alpha/beta hydrolase family esterase